MDKLDKILDILTKSPLIGYSDKRLDNVLGTLSGEELDMAGTIRTREKCPDCGGKFKDFSKALACENCLGEGKISIPKRLYIDIYHHKKYKLYSDNDGEPLESYERAKRLLIEINQRIRKPNYTFNPADYVAKDCRKLQFNKYTDKWIQNYNLRYQNDEISIGRVVGVERAVRKYYVPYFVSQDIREIYTADIEDFYLSLPALKPKTKKELLATLHTLFIYAKRRRDIKEIPEFPKVKLDEQVTYWINEETQDLIYQHIPDHHKLIFLFLFRQGVRPGEARAVHWEDINFDNRTVTICRTYYRQILKNRTKSRHNRTIPIDNDVYKLLSKKRGIAGLIFTLRNRNYGNESLGTIWRTTLKKMGMKHLPLYNGTRHSFASQAANRGVSREQIGAFLGHMDYSTTKRYVHMNMKGLIPVLRADVIKLRKNETIL